MLLMLEARSKWSLRCLFDFTARALRRKGIRYFETQRHEGTKDHEVSYDSSNNFIQVRYTH